MQRTIALALVLGLLASTACYHVTYTTGKPIGGIKVKDTNAFFLGGLIGKGNIDVPAICKNGAAKVHVWQTLGDGFLGALTASIYVPRTYEVWCAADETASTTDRSSMDPATPAIIATADTAVSAR